MAHQPPGINPDSNYAQSPSYAPPEHSAFPPTSSFTARASASSSSYPRRGLTSPSIPSTGPSAFASLGSRLNGRHPLSLSREDRFAGGASGGLLPRLQLAVRHPTRAARLLALVAVLLVGWLTLARSAKPTQRIATRWWDPRGSGQCCSFSCSVRLAGWARRGWLPPSCLSCRARRRSTTEARAPGERGGEGKSTARSLFRSSSAARGALGGSVRAGSTCSQG